MKISTVGVDLAKNVFQGHAVGETGEVVVRRALRRRQVMPFFRKLEPCLIGIEARGTGHFWARERSGLGPSGQADAAGLCSSLCQAGQDRRG